MNAASHLSVREAADRLGLGPAAVRQHIAAGSLPAVKRGRGWWLDAKAVERMARQRPGAGRPLSPDMAWAVLLLASGEPSAAQDAAGRDRYWSRARAWLREHPLEEHASRLRTRAQQEEFHAHPAELARILRRPDVLATGISAGDVVGLAGPASSLEVYAPRSRRRHLVDEHALEPGGGPVRVRWVSDHVWRLIAGNAARRAPWAAVVLDLLEHDDPRARRQAARALAA